MLSDSEPSPNTTEHPEAQETINLRLTGEKLRQGLLDLRRPYVFRNPQLRAHYVNREREPNHAGSVNQTARSARVAYHTVFQPEKGRYNASLMRSFLTMLLGALGALG